MSNFFTPITGSVQPRFSGVPTLMRLPALDFTDTRFSELDIALVGVPWDGGTTNHPGARHGPRQVRDASAMVRNVNRASGINPFALCHCADLGDTPVNPVDLLDSLHRIEAFYAQLHAAKVAPLSIGSDHLVSLPILRAIGKPAPVGMIHFDAHTDTWDSYFGGSKYTHGTGFRRAIEEGVLDPQRTVQIGIRGALYHDAEDTWGQEQGIRVIDIDEFHALGINAVIAEARRIVGDGPTYVSFDVDAFDPSGNTALVAATLAFEILCVLADSRHRRKSKEG